MSGASDVATGLHVTSWGWSVDECPQVAGGPDVSTTLRTWRVSLNNKLICHLSLPEGKDAGDALMLAHGMLTSDGYEAVFG